MLVDAHGDGPVVLAMALRTEHAGIVTFEVHVPRQKYDGTLLLDLIERHGATVH